MKQPGDDKTLDLPLVQIQFTEAEAELVRNLLEDRFRELGRRQVITLDPIEREENHQGQKIAITALAKIMGAV